MMTTAAAPPAAAAAARAGVAGPQSALPWLPQAEALQPVGTGHWLTQQERMVSPAVLGQHDVPHVQQFCTLPRPASWPTTDCGPPSLLLSAASSRPRGSVDSSSDQPRSAAADTGGAAVNQNRLQAQTAKMAGTQELASRAACCHGLKCGTLVQPQLLASTLLSYQARWVVDRLTGCSQVLQQAHHVLRHRRVVGAYERHERQHLRR